ncbi:hypothetical protein JW826_04245 [Candidatus Woesearchaeota archaeon]|nr:hypothetical protein [Candidatus Woesearchaeota archaeon]
MVRKKGATRKRLVPESSSKYEKDIKNLPEHELRELLLINMYKQALLRAQLEAVTNILIKRKLATYEEIWKETNENFKNTV